MRDAPGNNSTARTQWRFWVAPEVAVVITLLLIGAGGYAFLASGPGLRSAPTAVSEQHEKRANAEAEEAERQRLATAAEAEAKRQVDEAVRQRMAAVKAEQERIASTKAEAQARSKAGHPPLSDAAPSSGSASGSPGSAGGRGGSGSAASSADHGAQQSLPPFPWPPPTASAFYVLPDNWLEVFHTLGDVVNAIISALERNGYVERSFFGIEGRGVALVTRLERINSDGSSSAEPQRWPGAGYSLSGFLRGLFFVEPGHYRVIVFILRDRPFSQSSQIVTREEARAWIYGGADTLLPEVANLAFSGWHCTVLIYEFASDGRSVRVVESSLTGKQHLTKAGLLSLLEKN